MTTYYTIQCWRYEYDEWESENLYESFDEACDALDEDIQKYSDSDYGISEYTKPNREEKFKKIEENQKVIYYESPRNHNFVIRTMKVVPKKETTVYTYTATSRSQRIMVSQDYTSFDEACDRLNKTMQRDYNDPNWQPPMTREEVKEELDKNLSFGYAIFDDGLGAPLTYTLRKH